jgi:hypothetical protein
MELKRHPPANAQEAKAEDLELASQPDAEERADTDQQRRQQKQGGQSA